MNYRRLPGPVGLTPIVLASLLGGCANNRPAHGVAALQVQSQLAIESVSGELPTADLGVGTESWHNDVADEALDSCQHEREVVHQDERLRFIPTDLPEPFGLSLTQGWFDEWPHNHFSRRGTPFVHLFKTEPAFLDRDLFLDSRIVQGKDGDEIEIEAELEWAFTRRIGLVVELPFRFLEPDTGRAEEGIGDFAVAPRFLMIDTESFLLSLNLEVAAATGSARRGLGRGETSLSPTLSWWYDLGNWVTLSGQAGTEHGLESGDDEVVYSAALTYSLLGTALFDEHHHAHDADVRHFPSGMVNLMTEFTGKTEMSGAERGRSTGGILFGVSYLVTSSWEIRAAAEFPLFNPREFDNMYTLGLIYHF